MRRLYALGAHGVIACVLTSALAAALLIGRVALSGGPLFLFLGWNLILAWVPLLAVLPLAALRGPSLRDRLLALPFLGVWLAFLPNAPYLLTDVQHLAERAPVPLWCDAVLLGAFAVAGLTLTAASVYASWRAIAQVYTPFLAHASLVAVGPLVGLGMYLGRFLRWNSWDLVTRPGLVLADNIIAQGR